MLGLEYLLKKWAIILIDFNEIFLIKSSNNSCAADMAITNKQYEVAISRYYYSIYQKMLYSLYTKHKAYDYKNSKAQGGSHEKVIYDFRAYIDKNFFRSGMIDKKYAGTLSKFALLKSLRVAADYSRKDITKDILENEFMIYYNACCNLIDLTQIPKL